jgi:hypothetical protein
VTFLVAEEPDEPEPAPEEPLSSITEGGESSAVTLVLVLVWVLVLVLQLAAIVPADTGPSSSESESVTSSLSEASKSE